jgi:hypothetical protein
MKKKPVVEIDFEWGSWASTLDSDYSSQTNLENVAEVIYEHQFLSKITLNVWRITIK